MNITSRWPSTRCLLLVGLLVLAAGCGGSGSAGSAATLVSISVSPAQQKLSKGQSLIYSATGLYSDGHTAALSPQWASDDRALASIDPDSGLATAVTVGTVGITAQLGSLTGRATLAVTPIRLTPSATRLLGPDGKAVLLHGANLRDNLLANGQSVAIVDPAEADDLASGLRFNFVRLRLSIERGNRDDADPSGLSASARQAVADAIALLSARRIWILLELRTDDATANSAAFYDTTSSEFAQYRKVWSWLARTYRDTDYIAGYGLLAEPSPDKAYADPVSVLIKFQAALMSAIAQQDPLTPFFIGTAFNYDTMGFRWDAYFDDPQLQPYHARLVYEVNVLTPKPWIASGQLPPGVAPDAAVWPQSAVSDFSPLLTVAPGEKFVRPQDDEKIFNKRLPEPLNFPLAMSKSFLVWYLAFANDFADRHQVPMVVDQFGATTLVNTPDHPAQQLAYEQDLIDTTEAAGMGWCRWLYSGATDRSIAGNPAVHDFYQSIGAARSGP